MLTRTGARRCRRNISRPVWWPLALSPPAPRRRVLVAAGLVVAEGRVLLTRRRADQPHPGKWELPGGKIEPGESPTDALARELREEIAAQVVVGPVWDVLFHPYPAFDLIMIVYACRLPPSETPQCRQVEKLAWVGRKDLQNYDILQADAPLIARLQREGAPDPGPGLGNDAGPPSGG